jgi:hypothetical protein
MSVNFPSQHCTASRPSDVPSATRMQLREATESVRPSRVSGKGRKRSERWSALSHSEVSRRNERARSDALPSTYSRRSVAGPIRTHAADILKHSQ